MAAVSVTCQQAALQKQETLEANKHRSAEPLAGSASMEGDECDFSSEPSEISRSNRGSVSSSVTRGGVQVRVAVLMQAQVFRVSIAVFCNRTARCENRAGSRSPKHQP
ncbi:hypothetical protein PHYPO_G00076030 [Pangasianodon hypophthalmus]|uniref:Uncharacterized protein n=1 Tax=Pangasianodon hypophthalmus TaxID=310915 RepID=A0A5N5LM14_PANHP|nr:hypothetical protein PHYPO_G00076030 [Pangasianodon hypophthalmus]